MSSAPRIGWGHALTALGLLVRRASVPAALVVLAVLVFAGVSPPGRPIEPAWALALPLGAFVLCRIVAVGLAMVGWLVFPPEHRTLLGELAERAQDGAHRGP